MKLTAKEWMDLLQVHISGNYSVIIMEAYSVQLNFVIKHHTLKGQEHLGERRESDQKVEDYSTVGVVGAIVVGLVRDARQSWCCTGTTLVGQKLRERERERE